MKRSTFPRSHGNLHRCNARAPRSTRGSPSLGHGDAIDVRPQGLVASSLRLRSRDEDPAPEVDDVWTEVADHRRSPRAEDEATQFSETSDTCGCAGSVSMASATEKPGRTLVDAMLAALREQACEGEPDVDSLIERFLELRRDRDAGDAPDDASQRVTTRPPGAADA